MKQQDIFLGCLYTAKVAGNLTVVRIDSVSIYGGWNATNIATGKRVRIKTAARLRGNYIIDPIWVGAPTEAERSRSREAAYTSASQYKGEYGGADDI